MPRCCCFLVVNRLVTLRGPNPPTIPVLASYTRSTALRKTSTVRQWQRHGGQSNLESEAVAVCVLVGGAGNALMAKPGLVHVGRARSLVSLQNERDWFSVTVSSTPNPFRFVVFIRVKYWTVLDGCVWLSSV